ncbi:MAG: uracil-DNA glycosylase [Caldilineae bacterium]|nr:MAG: uracil-DNA glycosylase [Caldilineae bacterium]
MTDELSIIQQHIRDCRRCQQAGYPVQGPPIFSGTAASRLMVVGQAPGIVEVSKTHRPFSGSAGARLFRWLAQAGWEEQEFRRRFYMTSITRCFPGPNPSGRGDRVPTRKEQQLCNEWLEAELALVDPEVVIPVGSLAARRFFGKGYRLVDLVGQRFRLHGRIFVALPHPSGASGWLQQEENRRLIRKAIAILAQLREELRL